MVQKKKLTAKSKILHEEADSSVPSESPTITEKGAATTQTVHKKDKTSRDVSVKEKKGK